jgi:hypothetical protein
LNVEKLSESGGNWLAGELGHPATSELSWFWLMFDIFIERSYNQGPQADLSGARKETTPLPCPLPRLWALILALSPKTIQKV